MGAKPLSKPNIQMGMDDTLASAQGFEQALFLFCEQRETAMGIHKHVGDIAMGLMERFHVRERMDVIAKWFQMGSCLSGGTMMGGFYPPELMQSFLASVDEYQNSLEKLREKTEKSAKSG